MTDTPLIAAREEPAGIGFFEEWRGVSPVSVIDKVAPNLKKFMGSGHPLLGKTTSRVRRVLHTASMKIIRVQKNTVVARMAVGLGFGLGIALFQTARAASHQECGNWSVVPIWCRAEDGFGATASRPANPPRTALFRA